MKHLRISVPDWCYHAKLGPAEDHYRTLKRLGVDAVEMVDPRRDALARAAGLEILNQSGPGMVDGINRVESHAKLLPEIRAALRQAATRGIPLLIVFSGNRNGQDDETGIENCLRGLREVLPDAEAAGVVLGFEMLCTASHPDYQACHGRYGFELWRRAASPWLKLVYDLYHLSREGDDVVADATRNLDAIAHVHLAESPGRGAPQAAGNIPYGRIVPAMVAAGYEGYWGLEFCPGGDPLGELEQSIAMLRSVGE